MLKSEKVCKSCSVLDAAYKEASRNFLCRRFPKGIVQQYFVGSRTSFVRRRCLLGVLGWEGMETVEGHQHLHLSEFCHSCARANPSRERCSFFRSHFKTMEVCYILFRMFYVWCFDARSCNTCDAHLSGSDMTVQSNMTVPSLYNHVQTCWLPDRELLVLERHMHRTERGWANPTIMFWPQVNQVGWWKPANLASHEARAWSTLTTIVSKLTESVPPLCPLPSQTEKWTGCSKESVRGTAGLVRGPYPQQVPGWKKNQLECCETSHHFGIYFRAWAYCCMPPWSGLTGGNQLQRFNPNEVPSERIIRSTGCRRDIGNPNGLCASCLSQRRSANHVRFWMQPTKKPRAISRAVVSQKGLCSTIGKERLNLKHLLYEDDVCLVCWAERAWKKWKEISICTFSEFCHSCAWANPSGDCCSFFRSHFKEKQVCYVLFRMFYVWCFHAGSCNTGDAQFSSDMMVQSLRGICAEPIQPSCFDHKWIKLADGTPQLSQPWSESIVESDDHSSEAHSGTVRTTTLSPTEPLWKVDMQLPRKHLL